MSTIDRASELRQEIKELEEALKSPDSSWCLGDPYEALDHLYRELDKAEKEG